MYVFIVHHNVNQESPVQNTTTCRCTVIEASKPCAIRDQRYTYETKRTKTAARTTRTELPLGKAAPLLVQLLLLLALVAAALLVTVEDLLVVVAVVG